MIEVGTLASGSYASDVYPFEVIKVSPSGKTITIRRMNSVLKKSSNWLEQDHDFYPNENGTIYTVRFTKRGWRTPCNMRITFGHAREYRDPHV